MSTRDSALDKILTGVLKKKSLQDSGDCCENWGMKLSVMPKPD